MSEMNTKMGSMSDRIDSMEKNKLTPTKGK